MSMRHLHVVDVLMDLVEGVLLPVVTHRSDVKGIKNFDRNAREERGLRVELKLLHSVQVVRYELVKLWLEVLTHVKHAQLVSILNHLRSVSVNVSAQVHYSIVVGRVSNSSQVRLILRVVFELLVAVSIQVTNMI